jgi:hypothetical protein
MAVLVHVEFRGWPILRHSWTQIDTEQNLETDFKEEKDTEFQDEPI